DRAMDAVVDVQVGVDDARKQLRAAEIDPDNALRRHLGHYRPAWQTTVTTSRGAARGRRIASTVPAPTSLRRAAEPVRTRPPTRATARSRAACASACAARTRGW